MRIRLGSYPQYEVFLNYPFDFEYAPFADALHFGVVAAGLRPVCAKDLSMPDRSRLEGIVDAIAKCNFSIHDLSRCGQPRQNMALELGMAFAIMSETQHRDHRAASVVLAQTDYRRFISDLGGYDPRLYHDDLSLVLSVYEWLRDVVGDRVFSRQSTVAVKVAYEEFKGDLNRLEGSGEAGRPSHDEALELMFTLCERRGWWDWRATKAGQIEFPRIPLSWRPEVSELSGR
jgi:hypothetical protein